MDNRNKNMDFDLKNRNIFYLSALIAFFSAALVGLFLIRKLITPTELPPRPEVTITIPEGFTVVEIGERLARAGLRPAGDLAELTVGELKKKRTIAGYEFLKDVPDGASLEGFLFPDTYRFWQDSSLASILEKLLGNFDKKVIAEWRAEIIKQNKNIYDIVTMASLLENEVRSDADRAVVSGILWKRLAAGMPLQVDATICYIKEAQKGKNCLPISISDLQFNSLYNTYRYKGLPLGPIANPGISAVKAAIWPKTSPYFFYLSASGGRTIFSKTYEEHLRAKRKYL